MMYETLVLKSLIASQRQFAREQGMVVPFLETGVTNAAAVIAVVDWAYEYPHPMPPKVHVSGIDLPLVARLRMTQDNSCCQEAEA